jgi:hypothetical protein
MGLSLTSGEPLTGRTVWSDVDAAGPASRGTGPAAFCTAGSPGAS